MPVFDGQKFACASCIKGHRVSGCNHHDRELHHINPKGRPVKQCEHCRGARKSKSHHAKCDCGDKKDKDKHKDKGDAKVSDNSCCCHSGAKCVCGGKKESPDLKLDTGKQTLHAARAKPKLTTTHSESTLTVFANGHHKPCHRNNNSAHVSGLPYSYKLSRPHTLHGHAAFASLAQGASCARSDDVAQRAVDTHSLSNNDFYAFLGSQRSTELPSANVVANDFQEPLFTGLSTNFSPDANSPSESHLSDSITGQQWPWANTITPIARNFGYGSLSTSPSQDCLPNLDSEWGIPSAGLTNPLWSAGDLPLDPNKLTDTLAQPISHSGESNQHSNPGLTTASSSHSEIGETTLFGDLDMKNPPSAVSETLFWEDNPVFRMAPSVPGEMRSTPTSAPATASTSSQGLEADFTKDLSGTGLAGTSGAMGLYAAMDYSETPAISMPNNLEDVSNDPWLLDQNNVFDFDSTYNWA